MLFFTKRQANQAFLPQTPLPLTETLNFVPDVDFFCSFPNVLCH